MAKGENENGLTWERWRAAARCDDTPEARRERIDAWLKESGESKGHRRGSSRTTGNSSGYSSGRKAGERASLRAGRSLPG